MDANLAWKDYHKCLKEDLRIHADTFIHLLHSKWYKDKEIKTDTEYLAESYKAMVDRYGEDRTYEEGRITNYARW